MTINQVKENLLAKALAYLETHALDQADRCIAMHSVLVYSQTQEKMTDLSVKGHNPFDTMDEDETVG